MSNESIEVPSAAEATVVLGNDHAEDNLLVFDDVKEQPEATELKEVESATSSSKALQLVPLELPKLTATYSSNSLVEVPLHESSDEEFADIDGGIGDDDEVDEGENDDHLSPLMMDNHTVIEHLEGFLQSSPSRSPAMEHVPVMVVDSAGNITIMKHSDTKDSLSSVDSDLSSSSFGRMGLQFSVDDTQGNTSSDNDPSSRDSGCETGPCLPSRPYCPVEADEGVAPHVDDDELPEDRPFEVPDDEFSERIVEQVEFYFSNESILKDAFLLKHVRRNKEGFVSLKLVSSFKRVRQLTKDWRVVGHAIQRKSKDVELNDVGTKVRRLEPLPNYDETMPSRTVVATDLGLEKITIEKVYEMFSSFGEIALVRILRVGGPIPADVRQFINKYPELLQKECALVEFVESRSARNALEYEGITVLEMIAPKKKTGKKAPTPTTRTMDNNNHSHTYHPSSMLMYGSPGMDQERSRGGAPLENSTAPRFQIRRTASGYYSKPDQVIYVPPPRKFGFSSGFAPGYAPNPNPTPNHHSAQPQYQQYHQPAAHHHSHQHQQQPQLAQPHYHVPVPQVSPPSPPSSSSPEHYEVYRRTSNGHIVAVSGSPINSRRYTNCASEAIIPDMRRGSLPLNEMGPRKMHSQQPVAVTTPQPQYECQCNCQAQQRRVSVSSSSVPNGNEFMYRRLSQNAPVLVGGESPRKLSVNSGSFERKTSVTETNWRNEAPQPQQQHPPMERKYSNDQMTVQFHPHHQHHHHNQSMPESPIRKFSNGFDPLRKLSNADEYVNGRRISTDSGYDRKYSFSSDCSRSRSNSFVCTHAPVVEQIMRTPTGPAGDGSRGFGQRTRKIGHILPPV